MTRGRFPVARALLHQLELQDEICVAAVRKAYAEAPRQDAFKAAVAAWRKHNPNSLPQAAAAAVANIIGKKDPGRETTGAGS